MPLDDRSHYNVQDRPVDTRFHLDRALTKLYRAEDCDRIGHLYYALLEEAADQLELAGRFDLAKRLVNNGDLSCVTDAVRALLKDTGHV